jgi:hypothetical protein
MANADVVERVKLGKDKPAALAGFDEIGVIAEPEHVLVGWRRGRRQKLGREAAKAAMKLTKTPPKREEPGSAKPPVGESGGPGDGDLAERFEEQKAELAEARQSNEDLEREKKALKDRNEALEAEKQELEAKVAAYESSSLDVVIEPKPKRTESGLKRGFNKTTGWVGSKLSWGSEPVYTSSHIENRDDGPVVVVEEEVVDGYREADRRRGAVVIVGAAALIGAGVLGAYLWGEHEEHEGSQSQIHKTEIVQHNSAVLRAKLHGRDVTIGGLREDLKEARATIRGLRAAEVQEEAQERAQELNHGALGAIYSVEQGNGITNEIQDFAACNGYEVPSGAQAWMIYENLRADHGDDLLVTPSGGDDTYIRSQGDVGISHPGPAQFPRGVELDLRQRLTPIR